MPAHVLLCKAPAAGSHSTTATSYCTRSCGHTCRTPDCPPHRMRGPLVRLFNAFRKVSYWDAVHCQSTMGHRGRVQGSGYALHGRGNARCSRGGTGTVRFNAARLLKVLAMSMLVIPGCRAASGAEPSAGASGPLKGSEFSPGIAPRWSHSSAVLGNKLYVVGGKSGAGSKTSDYAPSFLSLDLSRDIDAADAPWVEVEQSQKSPMPLVAGHTAVVNGAIDMMIVFGGLWPDDIGHEAPQLYIYNAIFEQWRYHNDTASPPISLHNHTAVFHPFSGDMVVFGGDSVNTIESRNSSRRENSSKSINNGNAGGELSVWSRLLRMVTDTRTHVVIMQTISGALEDLYTEPKQAAKESQMPSDSVPGDSSSIASRATPTRASPTPTTPHRQTTKTITKTTTENPTPEDVEFGTPTSTWSPKKMEPTLEKDLREDHSNGIVDGLVDVIADVGSVILSPLVGGHDDDSDPPNSSSGLSKRASDSLDLNVMSWINDPLPKGVSGRTGHTASVVAGRYMVVLGGVGGADGGGEAGSKSGLVPLDDIYVYDMLMRTWVRLSASGSVPESRQSHVASVVNETVIVIHGGADQEFANALDTVSVLDTETWTWSSPQIANRPAARYAHSATQAGPYMLITFGKVLGKNAQDEQGSGLFILDTDRWEFVSRYNSKRAGVYAASANRGPISAGTIFGLVVSCLVGLIVILILVYIAYIHYCNKHPRLSDSDEDYVDSPTTELRSIGRKLTGKFVSRLRSHHRHYIPDTQKPYNNEAWKRASHMSFQLGPAISLTSMREGSQAHQGDSANMRIKFDLDRDSASIDHYNSEASAAEKKGDGHIQDGHVQDGHFQDASGVRYSHRVHLDDVELPAGLRNRDDMYAIEHPNRPSQSGNPEPRSSSIFPVNMQKDSENNKSNDKPRSASRKKRGNAPKRVSEMLPRIVGSRLTLLPETASALARYRFEELEEDYRPENTPPVPPITIPRSTSAHHDRQSPNSIALLANASSEYGGMLVPPVMPAARYERSISPKSSISDGRDGSSDTRDSIDVNAVISKINKQDFFVVNP